MKCADIPDDHVIDLARRWHEDYTQPGVVDALVAEGIPDKLALTKVMLLVTKRKLDYGVSPRFAWPA